jgi:hypothetical protein
MISLLLFIFRSYLFLTTLLRTHRLLLSSRRALRTPGAAARRKALAWEGLAPLFVCVSHVRS